MDKLELQQQMSEIGILRALNSPYVAAILDVFEDLEHIYIVQEFIDGSSLMDLAMKGNMGERIVQAIMKGLVSGLCYLAENGVAHRDIKLENIMITAKKDSKG